MDIILFMMVRLLKREELVQTTMITSSSFGWIFLKHSLELAEANERDESRRAPLELWFLWSCREVWGE